MDDAPKLLWPGSEEASTPPAPGELELVRSFLSMHDHVHGSRVSLAPSDAMVAWWFSDSGLVPPGTDLSEEDVRLARTVLNALRSMILETGAPSDPEATTHLNAVAAEVGLRVCFGCEEEGRIHTDAEGVRGAVGRLLGIAFLAELDGSWAHLKACASPDCREMFYDRSKNRSGKWCTMQTCGNRAKVRAFRERSKAVSE